MGIQQSLKIKQLLLRLKSMIGIRIPSDNIGHGFMTKLNMPEIVDLLSHQTAGHILFQKIF
ncbi:MAG: hypothetical protein ACI9HY_000917 [Planctomycetaceae bacterium]|jgi:hypothetical protein